MEDVSINENLQEDLIHRLDILKDILNVLKDDKSISDLSKILDDYNKIEMFFKQNRQKMLDIEILNINGILEASRMMESEDILKTFQELKEKLDTIQNDTREIAESFNQRKETIDDVETNLHRLFETIEYIEALNDDFKK